MATGSHMTTPRRKTLLIELLREEASAHTQPPIMATFGTCVRIDMTTTRTANMMAQGQYPLESSIPLLQNHPDIFSLCKFSGYSRGLTSCILEVRLSSADAAQPKQCSSRKLESHERKEQEFNVPSDTFDGTGGTKRSGNIMAVSHCRTSFETCLLFLADPVKDAVLFPGTALA